MPLAYKDMPASKASIKNIFTAEKKAVVNVGVYLPEDRTVKLCWADGTVTEGEFTNVEGFPITSKLVASDKAANDYFGYSVSVYGDTAVIGAYAADPGGTGDAGAAYVFTRSGTTWTEQAKLVASDKAASDQFGYSVSVYGDTAVIGAYAADPGGTANAGAAYVFTRSGTTWTEQAKLVASDKVANDSFGQSVSIYGDTAVIGAYQADPGGTSDAGAAYTYAATSDGQYAYIQADNALTGVIDIATGDAGTVYEYRGLVIEEGETLAASVSYGNSALQIQVRGFEE